MGGRAWGQRLGKTITAMRFAAALLVPLAFVLVACTPAQVPTAYDAPPEPELVHCCAHAERYPRLYIHIAEAMAGVISPFLGNKEPRPGLLATQPAAQAHVQERVRPLDIVLVRNMGRKSGQIIPGHFTHLAIYLGDEAALRRAGMWSHPAVLPHQAAVRAGGIWIESQIEGVHLSPSDDILNTDAVLVLRPALDTGARRAAWATAFGLLGRPFDTSFDATECARVCCTELVTLMMPDLNLPMRELYDRPVLVPDEVAAQALAGKGLSLVSYVLPDGPEGWQVAGRGEVIRDLNTYWNPANAPAFSPRAPVVPTPQPVCVGPPV